MAPLTGVAIILALSLVGSAVDVSIESSLTFDAEAAKSRPVSSVVALLQDYLKEMEKEADTDEEIYDKMACWCETGEKLKTKSIKDAELEITLIQGKIDGLAQLSAKLQTEIQHMDVFGVKLSGSLDKAITIHLKEVQEWQAEEKELLEAISALKAAIIVLSKHHAASFLQEKENSRYSQLSSATLSLQHALKNNEALLKGLLNPKQKATLASFLKTPNDYFSDEAAPKAGKSSDLLQSKYAPQSGEIVGILKQMLEGFTKDLTEGQAEAAANAKAFSETKVSLKAQITDNSAMLERKKAELADTNEKWAMLQMNLLDLQAVLKTDVAYLKMLKERCEMMDKEWEARQKMRAEEMEACTKALAILNSDDAQQTFSRTFNAAFLQTRMEASASNKLQSQASDLLKAEALKLRSPRLNALAVRVRLDAFVKVKAAINKMLAELTKEKADEIKHKDFCIDEFASNEMSTTKKTQEQTSLTAHIEDLKITIGDLAKEIAALKESIADMKLQLKRGGEDREKEHNEFLVIVADQRATQKTLKEAIGVLEKFYASKNAKSVALAQDGREPEGTVINIKQTHVYEVKETEVAGPPPPGGFSTYKKKTGVLPMLQDILADARKMEAETTRDEENAQKTYEDVVMDTNTNIEVATKAIVTKSAEKATLEKDLAEAEEALANVNLELEQLANYLSQLHLSCDYILKNFASRQSARDAEIEALKQALAILSGAKFTALLQR